MSLTLDMLAVVQALLYGARCGWRLELARLARLEKIEAYLIERANREG